MWQDLKWPAAKHLGQVELGLGIDRQGVGVDAGSMFAAILESVELAPAPLRPPRQA